MKYDPKDFIHTLHPTPSAEEPHPLDYYLSEASSQLSPRPEYDDPKLQDWEDDVRDRARTLKREADEAWRREEPGRRAAAIHHSQPNAQEFTSLLRAKLEDLKERHDLLEPFLSHVPAFYDRQQFRKHWTSP